MEGFCKYLGSCNPTYTLGVDFDYWKLLNYAKD